MAGTKQNERVTGYLVQIDRTVTENSICRISSPTYRPRVRAREPRGMRPAAAAGQAHGGEAGHQNVDGQNQTGLRPSSVSPSNSQSDSR